MFGMLPSINPKINRIAPGFRALSIYVEAAPCVDTTVGESALKEACQLVLNGQPAWAQTHLEAWGKVFQAFGSKPKRTPCSAEALRKRVLRDKAMPKLDPIVDLYNAVSLRYAVPVGGENIVAYHGTPYLTIAEGSEPFDTMKEGNPIIENPEPGEIIWRDDIGVTCRRWNWRQGVRTRLSATDQRMWFILESLPEMPVDELHAAGKMLTDGLDKMMPGVRYEITWLNMC